MVNPEDTIGNPTMMWTVSSGHREATRRNIENTLMLDRVSEKWVLGRCAVG